MNHDGSRIVERSRRAVAVVDNDATLLEVIRAILEYGGYRVVPYSTALDAHEGIAAAPPDLVIMDMIMHGESGEDLLEMLMSDPLTAKIPVIVCTASAVSSDHRQRLERHGFPLLRKPFELDDLLDTVRRSLG